jgi:hypothetical protein
MIFSFNLNCDVLKAMKLYLEFHMTPVAIT